jgi:maltose O-acetyltransferase
MSAWLRTLGTAARIRLLRSIGPSLPSSWLRRWAVAAQGYAIGRGVYIGEGLLISDELRQDNGHRLRIGDRVAIAQRVTIVLSSHPNNSRLHEVFGRTERPVVIGDDAWIGASAVILPGVTIGEAAVVGAGTVVTRAVAPWTVVTGNPGRVIREIRPPDDSAPVDRQRDAA